MGELVDLAIAGRTEEERYSVAYRSPVDLLSDLIREIEAGTVNPQAMMVCWAEPRGEGITRTAYRVVAEQPAMMLAGMLESIKLMVLE